jgi:hypothetical protein
MNGVSDAPQPTEKSFLDNAREAASLVRDVGMIIGIPALLTIGLKLYDLQTKALEAQNKAAEAQVKSLESQNAFLRETQYDRALALLKSQKEIFLIERDSLEKQISDLRTSGHDVSATSALAGKLAETQLLVTSSDALIKAWEQCVGPAINRANVRRLTDCNSVLEESVESLKRSRQRTDRQRCRGVASGYWGAPVTAGHEARRLLVTLS